MIKRLAISIIFALQIFFVVYARFADEKFFCWAPYDQISQYKINVFINGGKLSKAEIYNRYRKNPNGFENRNIDNLKFLLIAVEKSTICNEDLRVELIYSTNKRNEEFWILESPDYEWICVK